MVIFFTIIVIFVLLVCLVVVKPRGYPPGPIWLPIVGSYLWFRREKARVGFHHLVWSSLSAQYGPVAGVKLGRDSIVIVSGYEAAKEVLLRDDFDGRPDGFFFRLRTFGERLGVVFTDGPVWQEQRRFCVQHLRQLGLGTRSMEAYIEEEAQDLVTLLRSKCAGGSTPVPMHDAFDVCVLNSLWAVLAGHTFSLDDQRLVDLLDIVHKCFRMIDPSGGILNQMPFLRFIAPQKSGYTNIMTHLNRMWNFLKETIEEHRNSFNADSMRDLIDLYLLEMETRRFQTNSSFQDLQLVSLCLDLFMAGSETTSNTLGFAVLYMLLYPQVQRRVQEELDRHVGSDREPTLQDRRSLRYVEAVLMEVQRHANIAPSGIPHRALKSTMLMGHSIPKGTILLVSLWSLHRDVKHWGDPDVFRPGRFINEEGEIIQDDWFIPFGMGKRRCLGETLAKASLFLFFSTLLHNFSISLPPYEPMPSLEGYDGVTLSPKPFSVKLVPRK